MDPENTKKNSDNYLWFEKKFPIDDNFDKTHVIEFIST